MKSRVASIIVTYNENVSLYNLLIKIGEQNVKSTVILIIDNSTEEVYRNKIIEIINGFYTNYKIPVKYYSTIKNLGSSLGFSIGMTLALDNNIDYVWLHDQDGYPQKNCLEIMLNYFSIPNVSIVAPVIHDFNNQKLNYFRCTRNVFGKYIDVISNTNTIDIDVAGTAGILIKSDTISKIGPYDGKNFFVGLEDFEYCLRVKMSGYKILLANNAIYTHPDLIKKHKQKQYISNNLKKKLPLGFRILKANTSKRDFKLPYSSAYLSYKYNNDWQFICNMLYSIFKAIVLKLFNRKVRLLQTLKMYMKAIINFKKHDEEYSLDNIIKEYSGLIAKKIEVGKM
ncbi:glycosyltransferase [Clostridium estertheticum]|uniref:Glycosyltransferase n=1 Tax=Clostridium estertheticum TaxID=238834 RepID=A0AA47EHP7_9CLOT|nr:glycosyltransferase [Clostridium estertheticum]MBU3155331.1 glycosyltransferase [Clostridium estertheticum]WAG60389.1 glycosyltransferase [Clostridium estertheticum]